MAHIELPTVVCSAPLPLKALGYSGQHTLEPCLDVLSQIANDDDSVGLFARGRKVALMSWKREDLLQLSCCFVELHMEVVLRQTTEDYVECKVAGEATNTTDAHHLYALIFLETLVNFCGGGKRPVFEVACASGAAQRLFVKLKKDAVLWASSMVTTAAATPVCALSGWLRSKNVTKDVAKTLTDMFCALVDDPSVTHWQKAIRCSSGWTPALLKAQMELWETRLSAL
jgi:hypothetical protein